MKKYALLLAIHCLWMNSVAAADDIKVKSSPACDKVEGACAKAGYMRGLAQSGDGKDLDKGCLQPLVKGQTVPGVDVDADTLKQCQQDQQKKPESSGHHRHG